MITLSFSVFYLTEKKVEQNLSKTISYLSNFFPFPVGLKRHFKGMFVGWMVILFGEAGGVKVGKRLQVKLKKSGKL